MARGEVLFLFYVFLFIFGFCGCVLVAFIRFNDSSVELDPASIEIPSSGNTIAEERNTFILENVVIKKVLKNGGDNEIMLPREVGPSSITVTDLTDIEEGSGDSEKIENTFERPSETRVKENLLIEKSLRDGDSTSSSLHSPKHCTICMQQYIDGDDICWSANNRCYHVYHLSCITHWLLENDNCPTCRQNFLKDGDGAAIHSSE